MISILSKSGIIKFFLDCSEENSGDHGNSFVGGETVCHKGTSGIEKTIDESYTNISQCETEDYLTYSNNISGSSHDTAESLSNPKRFLSPSSKESYNDGISPNFVDTFIKGESFDEQIAKFCEAQALPSLRIEQQTSLKGKDNKVVRFDSGHGNSKLLVKDEFLAAVRDDLADEYPTLYQEPPSKITEAGRKYLAERVASATDAVAAAERHLRFNSNNDSRVMEEINSNNLSQEIRIKLGAPYESRSLLVSSSPSCTTSSFGVSYQYPFIPSLLADNSEETPSDSSIMQSMSMAAIESGGKSSNRKVGLNFHLSCTFSKQMYRPRFSIIRISTVVRII